VGVLIVTRAKRIGKNDQIQQASEGIKNSEFNRVFGNRSQG
jgi:hypothetical protein